MRAVITEKYDKSKNGGIILSWQRVEYKVSLLLYRRSMSNWKLSKAVSLEMIQLKEKVARFSSSSPFQNLEIITTLGVGGFGRVELVRGLRFKHLREVLWLFLFVCFYFRISWIYELLLSYSFKMKLRLYTFYSMLNSDRPLMIGCKTVVDISSLLCSFSLVYILFLIEMEGLEQWHKQ